MDDGDQPRLYGDLAWLFPFTSAPEDFVAEVEGAYGLLQHLTQGELRTLLHLGAGAGHIDHTLKRYLAVTGVDLSDRMLAMARELNPEVTYRLGDVRGVRLDDTFDAVLIDDVATYMLTEGDLRALFHTAWLHLRPGGVAVTFAEVTKETFTRNRTNCSTRAKGDIEVTQVENMFDPDPGDTTVEVTLVYLIRRDRQLEIVSDHQLIGLFSLETWRRMLLEVGYVLQEGELRPGVPLFICAKPASAT